MKKKYIGTTKKLSFLLFTIQFSKNDPSFKGFFHYSEARGLVNGFAFLFEKQGLFLLLLKKKVLRWVSKC